MRIRSTVALTALLLLTLPVNAQFEKGDLFVSLGGSWKSKEYRLKETLDQEVDLQVGFYAIKRVSVGVIGNWGLSKFSYEDVNEVTGVTYNNYKEGHWGGMGPFVRANLGVPSFSVFGQLSAVFGKAEQNSENNLTDGNEQYFRQDGNYQQLAFSGGVWWYFTRRIGVEALATADWTFANVRSGNVTSDGEVDSYNEQHLDDTGGGGSLRLIYWFRLDKGAKKPVQHGG